MRFSTSFLITLLSNLTIVLLDKGAGLVILWILKDKPAEKGILDLLATFPTILLALSNLGLAASAIYFVQRKEASIETAGRTTAFVALTWGSLVALVGVACVRLFAERSGTDAPLALLLPLALTVPFMLLTSYRNSLQLVLGRIRAYNLVHLIPSLAYLPAFLVMYFLVTSRRTALAVVWARFLPAVGLASLIVFLLRREIPIMPRFDARFFRRALSYGWRANLNSTLTVLNHRVDLYLVRALHHPGAGILLQAVVLAFAFGLPPDGGRELLARRIQAEVAFYSLAVTLAELVWYVPDALRDLLFAKVAGIDKAAASRFTPAVCRNTLLVCALGSLAVWFAHDPVLDVFLGDAWAGTWAAHVDPALAWLLPGTLFFTVAKVLQADLAGRGRINTCIGLGSIVFVTMLAGDVLLVPSYGATGAALASSVAYAASALASLIVYAKDTGVSIGALLIPRREDLAEYRGVWKRLTGRKETP